MAMSAYAPLLLPSLATRTEAAQMVLVLRSFMLAPDNILFRKNNSNISKYSWSHSMPSSRAPRNSEALSE